MMSVVFSSSGAEHVEHLRLVLERMRKYGLDIEGGKCQFGRKKA